MKGDPLLSRKLGNYEIEQRLGRGGMATVYRARQTSMARDVAIKVLTPELAADPQFIARFEREAQVIARLEHPRIVPVHDYGHEDDLFYLAMRLIEGESLHQRLLNGPLAPERAGRYLTQIAEALDYAHANNVVHRDLKPNNVLLDAWDNVYLVDFGLAKMLGTGQHLTATGTVIGTPAYMAPEQWRGETINACTDVYALGIILYEMLLGHPPFESDTPFTLMYKHLSDDPVFPREDAPDVSDALQSVIRRALAKVPADRFASAGDMARAYKAALRGEVVETPAESRDATAEGPTVTGASGVEGPIEVAAVEADSGLGDAAADLAAIPAPTDIQPPPGAFVPVGSPVMESVGGQPASASVAEQTSDTGTPERETPLPFDLPDDTPPAVRSMVTWAAERTEGLTIPGFISPVPSAVLPNIDEAQLPARRDPSGEWQMPVDAPALARVASALGEREVLVGALYVRGTGDWRNWRRLIFAGLIISVLGGIFGGLFNLWLFNAIGTLCWLYVLIQGIRTWRGTIGHFYAAFTPERMLLLPLTRAGEPRYGEVENAFWNSVTRLYMTDEYLWVEAAGAGGLHFLGWIPSQGMGGLRRQRQWLPHSPIPRMLRSKGFGVRPQ